MAEWYENEPIDGLLFSIREEVNGILAFDDVANRAYELAAMFRWLDKAMSSGSQTPTDWTTERGA